MKRFNLILSALAILTVLFVSSCKEDEKAIPKGVLDVTSDVTSITVGGTVNFTDASLNAESRAWTFAGGNPATSTDAKVAVTYSAAGDFKASVVVKYLDGNSETKDITITVVEPTVAVVAAFSADKTTTEEGMTVTFTDASTGAADSWAWTFEGGNPATSTEQNPTVTYATAGVYDAVLKVTRASDSETATETKTDYITIEAPVLADVVASFTSSATAIEEGATVTYTNTSTEGADTYMWTFAGGTPATSTDENPTVTYDAAGTYTVTLKATRSSDTNVSTKEMADLVTVTAKTTGGGGDVITPTVEPAGVVNQNGGLEGVTIDGDALTLLNWKAGFVHPEDGTDGRFAIESGKKTYVGTGTAFTYDASITSNASYQGTTHLRITQASDNGSDVFPYIAPVVGKEPNLQVGTTYVAKMMVKVLSAGAYDHSSAAAGSKATLSSFGHFTNTWGGLGTATDLTTLTKNEWVEVSFEFEATVVKDINAFLVLRVRGEADILIDNFFVTAK